MKIKWFHLTLFAILLTGLGAFFLWYPMPPQHQPVPEAPPEQATGHPAEPQNEGAAQRKVKIQGPALSEMAPVFEGSDLPNFQEAHEMNPDVHPSITMFHAMFPDKSMFEADPELEHFLKVFSSPEYNELISKPLTREEYDAFWTKNGIYRDPDRFTKEFREHFPTGEPEDYEPEMRAYLLELAKDIPDDELHLWEHKDRLIEPFLTDPRLRAWGAGQFQGRGGTFKNPGFGAWFNNTLRNRHSTPVTEASEMPLEAGFPEDPPNGNLLETPQQDTVTENFDSLLNTGTPSLEEGSHADTAPEPPEIIDVVDSLKLPEIPMEKSIEASLRAQLNPQRFSPKRLNTALQTLNRYGPEDGLRRLKESDPEVANIIEPHLVPRSGKSKEK